MGTSDGWSNVLSGVGSGPWSGLDRIVIDDPAPATPTESDASLRDRILYVAGDSAAFIQEVMRAQGKDLDDIAERPASPEKRMTASFKTHPTLTELLNAARDAAVKQCDGAPATPYTLSKFARAVHSAVLTQAALGQWRGLGIVDPDDLMPLEVTCSFGSVLLGEPAIKIDYDFKRTRLPFAVAESEAVK